MTIMLKKAVRIIPVLLMLAVTAGCSSVSFDPQEPALYIDKDGSITAAEIESFDNSTFSEERYKEDELRAFAEGEVAAYNQEIVGRNEAYEPEKDKKSEDTDPLPVAISSLTVEDNKAKLIIDYVNCDHYLAFTEADESVTGLLFANARQASEADLFPARLINAKGEEVDGSKYTDSEKAYVVSVVGTTHIIVNGRILGASEPVEILDDHTAYVNSTDAVSILFK